MTTPSFQLFRLKKKSLTIILDSFFLPPQVKCISKSRWLCLQNIPWSGHWAPPRQLLPWFNLLSSLASHQSLLTALWPTPLVLAQQIMWSFKNVGHVRSLLCSKYPSDSPVYLIVKAEALRWPPRPAPPILFWHISQYSPPSLIPLWSQWPSCWFHHMPVLFPLPLAPAVLPETFFPLYPHGSLPLLQVLPFFSDSFPDHPL